MSTLRQIIDGSGISAEGAGLDTSKGPDSLVHHLRKAAKTKVDYDVAKANLQSKLAPMQHLMQLTQQMHGPNPNDPNDPFQNPYMQTGEGGPGGVGQGMENQDDLQRTGDMKRPIQGDDVSNYNVKQTKGKVGQPSNDGNQRLQTPDSRLAQGKAPQRSTSGQKPPGKMTKPTDGKSAKKGKHIKLEISDDKMAAYGTSESVRKSWDTRGRGRNAEQASNAESHSPASDFHRDVAKVFSQWGDNKGARLHNAAAQAHATAYFAHNHPDPDAQSPSQYSKQAQDASKKANAYTDTNWSRLTRESKPTALAAFGTPESVSKAWDTRGRGKHTSSLAHDVLSKAGFHHVESTNTTSRYQHPDYAGSVFTKGSQWMHVAPGLDKPAGQGTESGRLEKYLSSKSFKDRYGKDLAAEAIKNGMKRCKTCKNFFNPEHPQAGKSHCPGCKSGNSLSAFGFGMKPKLGVGPRMGARPGGVRTGMPSMGTTTRRGIKVKTTGDYHDGYVKSSPSVAVGLSAKGKIHGG